MSWKTLVWGVGIFASLVLVARLFGDPIIVFIHWAQGIKISF